MANFERDIAAMRTGKKVRREYLSELDSYLSLPEKYAFPPQREDIVVVPDPEPEPQWVMLEPGMIIREGDEFWHIGRQWMTVCGAFGSCYDGSGIFRRRIEVKS